MVHTGAVTPIERLARSFFASFCGKFKQQFKLFAELRVNPRWIAPSKNRLLSS